MKPLLLAVLLTASLLTGIGSRSHTDDAASPTGNQPHYTSAGLANAFALSRFVTPLPIMASASPQTTGVILRITPQTSTIALGEVFEVDIAIDSEAQEVSGVQAFIDFDPTVLQVQDANPGRDGVQIEGGATLPVNLVNRTDNDLGQIDYTASKLGGPFPSGSFVVATVELRAVGLTQPGGTALTFSFSTEEKRETIVEFGGDPILDEALGATAVVKSEIEQVDLSIIKLDEPDPVLAGAQLAYNIEATNNGPSEATEVVLIDNLPGGVEFVSADPSQGVCSEHSGTVTCNLGALSDGFAATVSVLVDVGALTKGTLVNLALVKSDGEDQDYFDNIAIEYTEVISPEADLSIIKLDDPDPVKAGSSITYTITVDNSGPHDATGVTVIDDLPPEVIFESASEGCAYYSVPHSVICELGDLAVDDNSTVTIVALPQSVGPVTNSAHVMGNEYDPDMTNNTANQTTTVDPVVSCAGQPATIIGTAANDTLVGTPGVDVIAGLEGNDMIFGLGGDDIICAGAGDDIVSGGPGFDRILGEAGRDIIAGNEDNDVIQGGDGNDLLIGGIGSDIATGGQGNDQIFGMEGNDMLIGGEDNDGIDCGSGFDLAIGGPGVDTAAPNCEITESVP